MRPRSEYLAACSLIEDGFNNCEISRRLKIPVTTVLRWRSSGPPGLRSPTCALCDDVPLDPDWYAYLLGLYLGDGCLIALPRGVYRFEISLDAAYPGIVVAARTAMESVRPTGVKLVDRKTYFIVTSSWKHWPCFFPQHGKGPKHLRKIGLSSWQESIVRSSPRAFLLGLVHSDGCRCINRIRRVWQGQTHRYQYPRYMFTNHSEDIRTLFCWACDLVGVSWRQMNWKTIAVSRRESVALLDEFIGPKT